MAKNYTYHEQQEMANTKKLREMMKELPVFCGDFFRGIEPKTSARTRIGYAYDLRIFFRFLVENNPSYKGTSMREFPFEDLDKITAFDLEEYMDYLKVYETPAGEIHKNDERGRHRKMSSLRTFYNYYNKRQLLKTNPVLMIDMPKLHEKEIIRLDADEVAKLLDLVEHGGDNLSPMKKVYYEKNKYRNLAIFTLLLGTGIRISECVGLNRNDIDFNNDRIKIVRKGGKEDFVYFGDEVRKALLDYLNKERNEISVKDEKDEDALFLSSLKKRISVRSIEVLVKENASKITSVKKITPHKLRSTYGTALYRETSDIYLVAEVLGHNDVNTTKKHYAALDEDLKRHASNIVRLRED